MKKSSRYWIRLVGAFANRFKLIFLIGIVMGVGFFVFLQILLPRLPRDIQSVGVVGEYTPNNLPISIAGLISTGLTSLDNSGQVSPGIADNWEASDSGKTWVFHLSKNVYWQDGSLVTSNDINYNFSDATVSKPDKYTVIFKLKTALAPFPVVLSRPIFKRGLLGVKEWKVTGLTLSGNYTETLTLTDKNNNEKIFKFYPSEDRAKLAYELGEVIKLTDLTDPKPFDSWKVANVVGNIDKQRYVAVFFNASDDILTDKDIRQALSYGIDKSAWADKRALGPISPNSWAYDPSVKPYDLDVAHAKDLINQSKIDPNQKKNLKVTLTTVPNLLDVANQIAKNWKEIGVTTTIQVTSFMPDNFQAFLAVYDIPTDPDQYSTWHSTQTSTNITRYKNPRIDKLLEDGRIETDQTKRKGVYFDFQKFLLEDPPAAFLYYPTYYTVSKK